MVMSEEEIEIVARAIREKDHRKPFESLPDLGHYTRMARHVLTALDQYREGEAWEPRNDAERAFGFPTHIPGLPASPKEEKEG
jgi:hypothetical protein